VANLIPPAALIELTTDSGSAPDPNVIAAAIAKADAEINSYIGVRYILPLEDVPEIITSISANIAVYYLYARRAVMQQVHRDNYLSALAFLKDIVAGRAKLKDAVGIEEVGAPEAVTDIQGSRRTFSRKKLRCW
jgi:phage gp36-like protein